MSQQNLLSIGFNVPELQAQAKEVEQIVVTLYNELKKYENVKLSPVDVTGLQQLTQSIKQQQAQISSLTQSVTNLGTVMANYNATLATVNTSTSAAAAGISATTSAITGNTAAVNANTSATGTNITSQQRMAATMGKNALAQNDLFKQLVQKQQDLRTRWQNAFITHGETSPITKGLQKELQEVSASIGTVQTAFQSATSGGVANFSRGLSTAFQGIRQIAYILPGLGIAGIFNIIFEAIMKVGTALLGTDEKLAVVIDSEKELNSTLGEQIKMLDQIRKLWDQIAQVQVGSATDMKRDLDLMIAGGATQMDIFAKQAEIAAKEFSDAKENLLTQGISEEFAKEELDRNKKLISDQQATYNSAKSLSDKFQLLANLGIESKNDIISFATKGIPGEETARKLITGLTEKELQIAQNTAKELRTTIETTENTNAKVAKANAENEKQKYQNIVDSTKSTLAVLTTYQDTRANVEKIAADRSKFLSDEQRKLDLGRAKDTFENAQTAANEIIKLETSTVTERVDAIKTLQAAQDAYAKAQMENVITSKTASGADRTLAIENYYQTVAKNASEAGKQITKLTLDFWVKQTEITHQAIQLDVLMSQLWHKTILDNEKEVYEKRIGALTDYANDREQLVYNQYQKDLEIARRTLDPETFILKEIQLKKEYKKQILDIENGLRKEAYDITKSWFDKEIKLIKDQYEEEEIAAENKAVDELLLLNEQFSNKEISYREFANKRKEIEYRTSLDIANAKVADDEKELKRLTDKQKEIADKLNNAKIGGTFATLFGSKEQSDIAKGQIDALTEDYAELGDDINAIDGKRSKDALDALNLRNKQEEDGIKQRNENYMKLEEELFNGIKDIVDAAFEARISKLEELTEAQNKAADDEIAAIERSTLSAKEKNAFEIQLNAQKESRDRRLAEQTKKIKHDEAVFDKSVAMTQIALNTAIAVTGALKVPGVGVGLAISYAALGAAQLAIAAATKIPEYAMGGIHKKEGLAIFGEAGAELVREPGKKPYITSQPTISHLSAGTELIPLYNIPVIQERKNESWEQTMYLGKQIAKSKREIKNIFKPKIIVDLNRQIYINRILHG